jgi:hypothetical protein
MARAAFTVYYERGSRFPTRAGKYFRLGASEPAELAQITRIAGL